MELTREDSCPIPFPSKVSMYGAKWLMANQLQHVSFGTWCMCYKCFVTTWTISRKMAWCGKECRHVKFHKGSEQSPWSLPSICIGMGRQSWLSSGMPRRSIIYYTLYTSTSHNIMCWTTSVLIFPTQHDLTISWIPVTCTQCVDSFCEKTWLIALLSADCIKSSVFRNFTIGNRQIIFSCVREVGSPAKTTSTTLLAWTVLFWDG